MAAVVVLMMILLPTQGEENGRGLIAKGCGGDLACSSNSGPSCCCWASMKLGSGISSSSSGSSWFVDWDWDWRSSSESFST